METGRPGAFGRQAKVSQGRSDDLVWQIVLESAAAMASAFIEAGQRGRDRVRTGSLSLGLVAVSAQPAGAWTGLPLQGASRGNKKKTPQESWAKKDGWRERRRTTAAPCVGRWSYQAS